MRFLLLASALVFSVCPAQAKTDRATPLKPDIAAIVGQDPISTFDVDNRLKFIIISSRLPNTPETMARLKPQVIRTLIDEKLQLQEAEKNAVKISDKEVTDTIAGMESGRGLPPGAIFALLAEHRLPKETFTHQIRAQLAWRKLVLKKIRPSVRISDEEVKLAALSPAAAAPQELKISVLTLPVDKPSHTAEAERTAQKLARDLRAGASFEEIARQLGSVKTTGDEAFWVRPEQLDPVLARALASAQAGSITEPIRGAAGFAIVKVYETRSTETPLVAEGEALLKEILLKLKSSDDQNDANLLLSIANEVTKNPGTCEEKGVAGIADLDTVNIEVTMHRKNLSELPEGIRGIVSDLKPGDISTPYASGSGILLYMLCERKERPLQEAEKERLKNQLYQEKIELEAQKYLRNLRRDTFIDVRV
jgi:peptidyl-prolyl cis-trans isomerase SurA